MSHDMAAGYKRVSKFRTFGFATVTTLLILSLVGWQGGWQDFLKVVILTVLEVTFSFDNAVVNARLLKHLNRFWQALFMSVGILIAVFVVRFALPIFIVQLTTGLGFMETVSLALNDPTTYAQELHKAGPFIDAFGGTFLIMIGIAYFMDEEKDVHWLSWLEQRLAPLGRFDNLSIFAMLGAAVVMGLTVPGEGAQFGVLLAAVCGVLLHVGLDLFEKVSDGNNEEDENEAEEATPKSNGSKRVKVLVGGAAFFMFCRLEVVDASFSFDGVIGAFAITTSVVIIAAGLANGAVWVRAMTVHLLRAGTLAKFRFLEHGAHWAILFLGLVMIAKLYHIEAPEWFTGSIGLVMIVLSAIWSKVVERREVNADERALETAAR
ncbi:MAG TPA: DUF475 domain-containing protein [Magnetospirillaceae bacterium]|nr:DUF475 domain-containing protein [Magnetospirillaceae bacterium]